MVYKEFILQLLKKSSLIASQKFGKVTSSVKKGDNNQVLTEADLEIGRLIVSEIKKKFPTHNIVNEETDAVNNHSKYTWAIDPIDGTSNFAVGLPMYGTMIGLLINDIPIAGGVVMPYFEEFYFAEKSEGAYLNGKRIKVTGESDLKNCLVSYGIDGYIDRPEATYRECQLLADIILNVRNIRSSNSCFDDLSVATGKYGGSLYRTNSIWDNVAAHIIVEEAGGVYTDFVGRAMDYKNAVNNIKKIYNVCISTPTLHPQLQRIIKKHGFAD